MVECAECGITLRPYDLTCPRCGHSRVDRVRARPPLPEQPGEGAGQRGSTPSSGRPISGYRSPTVRGRWTQALIFLVALAAGYGIWATWREITLLEHIRDGVFVSLDEAAASDARVSTAGLLYLVALIVSIATYLMWLHRAVGNLAVVRSGDAGTPLRFTPGWAVGWYFIPIMNLFRPFQVMGELYRESNPEHRSSPQITWWWVLWVAAAFLGPGLTGVLTDQNAGEAIVSDWRIIASNAVLIADAALIYLIIDRICVWQDRRGLA